jgi:DNA-directed RNA polymerase specialized sigma54-like protein
MSELLSEIKAEPSGSGGIRPTLTKIRHLLSEQDLKDLVAAFDDPTISGRSIATVLNRHGINISEATVYRYRTTGIYRELA